MPLTNLDCAIDPCHHADFTVGFVLDKLASAGKLGPSGAGLSGVENANVVQMNTGGFLSDIYRCHVQFKQQPGDQNNGNTTPQPSTFTCIFKESIMVWMHAVHNAECRFYTEIVPSLRAMSVPPPFRIPDLYSCRNSQSPDRLSGGYLLLEDMAGPGVIEVDLIEGLSKAQTESAIRGLAHFHALCLRLPRQLVDSLTMSAELDFDDTELRVTERLTDWPDTAQHFGGQTKQLLQQLFINHGRYTPDQHKQFSVPPVIVHGDFWSNNMFFKCSQQDKNVYDQLHALFDWQICHTGTGVNDLLRIIYVSVDAPLRRQHFDEWLSLYWSELHSVLTLLDKAALDAHQMPPAFANEQHEQPRSLPLIRQMAAHHAGYEACFQLFLFSNLLGTTQDEQKRRKLIKRMVDLFNDVQAVA